MKPPLQLPADVVDAIPEDLARRAGIDRHQARCAVCAHHDVREIEACYVAWAGEVRTLASNYDVPLLHLRRHAAVFLLDEVRGRGISAYLARILERQMPKLKDMDLSFEQIMAICDRMAILGGANGAADAMRELERNPNARTSPQLVGGAMSWEDRVRQAGRGAA